ncbi:MAG: immunoglobulin domain-containing protein, partial [Verrucomicrobia bacterium]|nr:immunoglobulin domain-containing protein [Verrucomicrobiota bacterium]
MIKLLMTLQSRVQTSGFLLGIIASATIVLTASADPTNCAPPPAGLVGWWQAEGNAGDVMGSNNGTVVNGAAFLSGKVGQAFSLNGVNQYVSIPDSPSLRPTNLTIEGWVNVSPALGIHVLFGKTYGGVASGDSWVVWRDNDAGTLNARVYTSSGWGPWLFANWAPVAGTWHHIAFAFDSGAHTQALYVDGLAVAGGAVSGDLTYDTHPLVIGAEIEDGVLSYFVNGLIDEVSFYNRALTPTEMQAIYNAGSAGKCVIPTAPFITSQPTNQKLIEGGTAIFTVGAGGTPPLGYQWQFNGTNIDGANGVSLTLSNVQFTQAGNYAVWVTNAYGSSLSSNALLTVNPPPPCAPPPAGLVSWWRGGGNGFDQVGTNNGTAVGNTTYGAGRVGQAFVFGGANGDGVTLGNPASLHLQDLTIEAWIKRANASQISTGPDGAGVLLAYGYGGYSIAVLAYGSLNFGKPYFSAVTSVAGLVADTMWHHVAVAKSGRTVV